jgi:putative ABC transport system permease protein
MTLHYLKSTFRYLQRSGIYAVLNITGLVVGITASAFLFIYVWDELRHDKFPTHADSIFRIITEQQDGSRGVTTPGPLGETLLANEPQVKAMARVGKWSGLFKSGTAVHEETEVYFADNAFFRIFDFPLLKGDASSILKNPTDLVLTEKTAIKFFGRDWDTRPDVIGYTIYMNEAPLTVAGVAADAPSYSSIQFDYLLSFEAMKTDHWNYQWGSHNFHTYVQLNTPAEADAFEKEIKGAIRNTEFNEGFALKLQPLKQIYMESFGGYDWGRHGDPEYVVAFAIIGVLILLVACFNYINLATSQAARRAREIGIRKINGASRFNIFLQFMGESTAFVVTAALIARALVDILLPYFNELSGKQFAIAEFQTELSILFVILAMVTSVLAGLYPSVALANLKSLSMVKKLSQKSPYGGLRLALVTAQFAIALILITGTLMMSRQLEYMQQRSLGFDTDELVYIKLAGALKGNNEKFKEDLSKLSYVHSAARATSTLVNTDNGGYIEWPGKLPGQEVIITQINVDADFLNTLNIQLLSGRNFNPSDSNAYILNETALKAMSLDADKALGTKLKFWGTEGYVIGVVSDFHFRPLHHRIAPLIIRHNPKENYYQMLVNVDRQQIETFKADAAALYRKYESEFPFSSGTINEAIERGYKKEQRVSSVVTLFSALSIIISLLGVLGLISHAIEDRSKEFTIRKVLGLRLRHLVLLVSSRMMVSYFIAIVIATPIAYLLIRQWLQNFSYSTTIAASVFAMSYGVICGLALTIIVVQSLIHIRKNSLDALRSE